MTDAERFNADHLALAAHYQETMDAVILPELEKRRVIVPMKGAGDKPLHVERYEAEAPRGTLVLVHGFTENAYKYSELIYSLLHSGYSVLTYDQRGHGRSWRDPQISDISLTHVDKFDEYVEDLRIIVDRALGDIPKPWAVFGHSMGGAVTGLFLERYPEVFSRAVLCAPMIAANLGPLAPAAAKAMCAAARLAGKGKVRTPNSRPYAGPEQFETSSATGRERFAWYDAVKAANPEFQNNGPSFSWLLEGVKVTDALLKPGEVEKIAVPVVLYTALLDTTVRADAQEKFISRVKLGRHVKVAGAKHEIYRSGDEVFFPWWRGILEFLGE